MARLFLRVQNFRVVTLFYESSGLAQMAVSTGLTKSGLYEDLQIAS